MNLYQVNQNYFNKLTLLTEMEDLTPEIIGDTLIDDSQDCAKAVGAWSKNLEAEIDAMKDYESEMAKRRQALEKRRDSFKAYLLQNMLRTGINKISSPEFNIKLVKNPDSLRVDSMTKPQDLPRQFVKKEITYKIDKMAIKERLNKGKTVKGCSLAESYRVEIK